MLNIKQLELTLSYLNSSDLKALSIETGVSMSVLKDIQLGANTVPYSAIKKLSEYYGEEE